VNPTDRMVAAAALRVALIRDRSWRAQMFVMALTGMLDKYGEGELARAVWDVVFKGEPAAPIMLQE
jgi:hypothetical protein